MPTRRQESEFLAKIISSDLLAEAIEWIGKNLEPDDVFSARDLATWATNNGIIEDVGDSQ